MDDYFWFLQRDSDMVHKRNAKVKVIFHEKEKQGFLFV